MDREADTEKGSGARKETTAMLYEENAGTVADITNDTAENVGTFAEGHSAYHLKRGTLRGDYAAGEEKVPRLGTIQPVGDFGVGLEEHPADPTTPRGDYARGLRR